jgi:hypothetical protein
VSAVHRRRLLAALGATTGLTGCLTGGSGDTTATGSDERETSPARTRSTSAGRVTSPTGPIAARGSPTTICQQSITDAGIYAVTDPQFGSDWADVDVGLPYRHDVDDPALFDDQAVVGLTTSDGRARAYPLTVLSTHEIVNDDFGGPVAVTYCPLCRSAVIVERRVEGEVTTFGVSGRLWVPDRFDFEESVDDDRVSGVAIDGETVQPSFSRALVMYDLATRSYWSQLLATAICGPATGDVLSIRPATLTDWGAWRREHPDTEVLLPPGEDAILKPGADEGYAPAGATPAVDGTATREDAGTATDSDPG